MLFVNRVIKLLFSGHDYRYTCTIETIDNRHVASKGNVIYLSSSGTKTKWHVYEDGRISTGTFRIKYVFKRDSGILSLNRDKRRAIAADFHYNVLADEYNLKLRNSQLFACPHRTDDNKVKLAFHESTELAIALQKSGQKCADNFAYIA